MSYKRVIETAKSELGNTEYPPNSNLTKYGKEYGMDGYYWCVIFLWWVFLHSGESDAFYGGNKAASCNTLYKWYSERGYVVKNVESAKPGDIVFMNFNGKKDLDHVGLVIENLGGSLKTIEGNTTPGLEGSQDNGGSVALKRRYSKNIVAIVRPPYKDDTVANDTKDDELASHWARDYILKVKAAGLMNGYSDGSFKPNDPITRAELAAVIARLLDKME